ncbi:saxitoxin and tetrodotoxin-binding protein 2-like [Trematomus bernacchii]|uniref:saxitoxin and tetrodotoxin-binding protein 2-like n=1 Tax=Trematomus bernacchii TaxID=40690 RepID=UPI00146A141D|nr:saxitoxin and tetrodotoxin-binding protein 2-like [Trematomus bernacchii]
MVSIMCLRGLLLVSGLFLSSWALTPEECQPLVTPLSLADPSMMYNRSHLLVGYSDNAAFGAMMKHMESSWWNISPSPSDPKGIVLVHEDKLNGTCMSTTANITIEGDTASASVGNVFSTTFHLLPGCDGCLVLSMNTTAKNMDTVVKLLKINITVTAEEVNLRCVYLLGREATLKDSDFDDFKKQASCLGFSGEPQFIYDSKNGYCAEGEGVKIELNSDGDE